MKTPIPPKTKRALLTLLSVLIIVTIAVGSSHAAPIELRIDSVVAVPGQQNVEIPVYLANSQDYIAGFQLWFLMERPDIIQFKPEEEEMISIDGTLLEQLGWSYATRSLGDMGTDLKVSSIFNPLEPVELDPQTGDIPLFKLRADVLNIPDFITDSTVYIHINSEVLDHFGFTDALGNSIGIETIEVEDTAYFQCLNWVMDECMWWEQVTESDPYDSVDIHMDLVAQKMPGYFETSDGSVTVVLCGDVNVDKAVNILDIVKLIDFKFKDGDTPTFMEICDVNQDGAINILDIVYLIDHKFNQGAAPVCY